MGRLRFRDQDTQFFSSNLLLLKDNSYLLSSKIRKLLNLRPLFSVGSPHEPFAEKNETKLNQLVHQRHSVFGLFQPFEVDNA